MPKNSTTSSCCSCWPAALTGNCLLLDAPCRDVTQHSVVVGTKQRTTAHFPRLLLTDRPACLRHSPRGLYTGELTCAGTATAATRHPSGCSKLLSLLLLSSAAATAATSLASPEPAAAAAAAGAPAATAGCAGGPLRLLLLLFGRVASINVGDRLQARRSKATVPSPSLPVHSPCTACLPPTGWRLPGPAPSPCNFR